MSHNIRITVDFEEIAVCKYNETCIILNKHTHCDFWDSTDEITEYEIHYNGHIIKRDTREQAEKDYKDLCYIVFLKIGV
jgi:hypothetical protein